MVNVRRSVPADLPGLMRVERESFPTPWSEESVLSFQNDPEHRLCYTATDDREAEVIGYLALQYVDDEAELCNIAVLPARRGGGIGALLIDTAVDFCSRKSIRLLHLEVRENNAPAIALYRRKGFCPVGIRRGYYADSGEDAFLFSRIIEHESPSDTG